MIFFSGILSGLAAACGYSLAYLFSKLFYEKSGKMQQAIAQIAPVVAPLAAIQIIQAAVPQVTVQQAVQAAAPQLVAAVAANIGQAAQRAETPQQALVSIIPMIAPQATPTQLRRIEQASPTQLMQALTPLVAPQVAMVLAGVEPPSLQWPHAR